MRKLISCPVAFLSSFYYLFIALLICSCTTTQIEQSNSKNQTTSIKASTGPLSPVHLYREIKVVKKFIPKGRYGRKYKRTMKPRYITVHSTQNYNGDAWDHARALEKGKLRAPKRRNGNRIGYLTWHFTVQEDVVIQHLPTIEQGEHADFNGPGNNYSIGIEMCEHRGNSRRSTLDRTAKLCASLMYQYKIPLKNVVPHQHWPRKGTKQEHKNCPHFLMTNGRPGKKWSQFLRSVKRQYNRIQVPQAVAMTGNE